MTVHYITEQNQLTESVIPKLYSSHVWGVDTETTGLDPHSDKVSLLQIGNTQDQYVIDTRTVNPEPLRGWFEDISIFKYLHNAKFDYKMIKGAFGIEMERMRDTFLGEQILTKGIKLSGFKLSEIMKNYLDVDMPNKEDMQKSFIGHTGPFSQAQIEYAARDVEFMVPLGRVISNHIKTKGLANTFVLECEAIPSFGDMELYGVLLNKDEWLKIAEENYNAAQEITKKMDWFAMQARDQAFRKKHIDMFGHPSINYNSAEQIVELIQALGIKIEIVDEDTGEIKQRLTVEDSSDKTLKKIIGYPVVELIKKYRGHMIRHNTFGKSFVDAIHPKTGRIHQLLDQIGADTGRITTNKKSPVSMLNIPRDKRMRNCFLAEEDHVIETDDYSGCELRIWAHISKDPGLVEALNRGVDLHCYVASKLYGVEVKKGTPEYRYRSPAKAFNFGIAYGMIAWSVYQKLNGEGFPIKYKDTVVLYNKYCREFSTGVRYLRTQGNIAAQKGFLFNLNGRRRHWLVPDPSDLQKFPLGRKDLKLRSLLGNIVRQGGNYKIQSVNADITKYAMTLIRRHIKKNKIRSNIMLQVYDEIATSTHKNDSEDFVLAKRKIMIEAAERWITSVPIEVDGQVKPYWTKD